MSFGSSKQTSKPKLFGPEDIESPEQQTAKKQLIPGLTAKALGGEGLTAEERATAKTRIGEDITAKTAASTESLRNIFAKSGIRGGTQKSDISDIIEESIRATGKGASDIEALNQQRKKENFNQLLQLIQTTPFGIGSEGKSRSSTFSF